MPRTESRSPGNKSAARKGKTAPGSCAAREPGAALLPRCAGADFRSVSRRQALRACGPSVRRFRPSRHTTRPSKRATACAAFCASNDLNSPRLHRSLGRSLILCPWLHYGGKMQLLRLGSPVSANRRRKALIESCCTLPSAESRFPLLWWMVSPQAAFFGVGQTTFVTSATPQ